MEKENIEVKVLGLKGKIVARMIENGADPTSPAQTMGLGVLRVVSDTDMDGFASLILHCSGEWSEKVGMDSFPVGETLDDVLVSYSTIVDPESREILDLDEDLERRAKGLEFLRLNRDRLAEGLVGALEITLQSL